MQSSTRVRRVSRAERVFQSEYAQFVDDLGGLLWKVRLLTVKSWEEIGRERHICGVTVANLANRKTTNPQGYTIWRILQAAGATLDGFDGRSPIGLGRGRLAQQYRSRRNRSTDRFVVIEGGKR